MEAESKGDTKTQRQLDKPLHDLIESIQFLESVSAKVHGCLNEAEIYNTILEEFAKSERYNISIFLLTNDGARIRFAETSLPSAMVEAGEKVVGLQSFKDFSFHLSKSSFFSQVVKEGKIIEANFADVIGELLPRLMATLVSRKIGYLRRSGFLAPLRRHGNIIGVLVVDSTELSNYLIPSVRNLAAHISTALTLASERAEREQAQEALRRSEERYRRLFEQSPIGIGISTIKGTMVDMNPAMQAITGFSREDIGKVNIDTYSNPEQRKKVLEFVKQHGYALNFPVRKKRKDGTPYDALLSVSQINIDGKVFLQTICQDITEKKRVEREMRSRLMKFRLEDGNIYLAREIVPALSIEAFKDLLKVGYRGLVISRTPKDEFNKNVEGTYEYLWLAERLLEGTPYSRLERVERLVECQPFGTVVLFDRLDYLVSKNGFGKILFLVQCLREIAYLSGNIIVLSVDPATIGSYELKLLEKETRQILPRFLHRLPEDMLEILRYVYKQNNLGAKPSYTDVRKEAGVSKPTVIKRIRRLIASGYVEDSLKGRSKVLELTQRGRDLFF